MFVEREASFFETEKLLKKCALNPVNQADYRMGIFSEDDELVATGALVGDMLQMIAVDPDYQGEDLAVRVVSHLLNYAILHGTFCLHLFTKSKNASIFESMGFQQVANVEGSVALLEWGKPGIADYCKRLQTLKVTDAKRVGCLVMNCNPFTKGHRYLTETAAQQCDFVYILAVEEDLSEFPFSVRFDLLRRGTADLKNVTVLPGGRYTISSLTFPAYFSRDTARSRLQSQIDAEIFVKHIAPALGVTDRYLGEEPFSPSTAIYNEVIQERLTRSGIQVNIVPRLKQGETVISASAVRRLLAGNIPEQARILLPETTAEYIYSNITQVKKWLAK